MDILNSHEYFNKLQVFKGIKQAHNNSVSAYVLECRVKKIIKLNTTTEILHKLTEIKNRQNKIPQKLIRREDLLDKTEKLKVNSLESLIELFEQEGIMECLTCLLNLKK